MATKMYDYRVSNAPFRQEYERQKQFGLTLAEIARRLDHPLPTADRDKQKTVSRYLGCSKAQNGMHLEEIPASVGVALMRAMHMWPQDCGL